MIGPAVHVLLALIMAGLVHIATVFAMPWLAQKDAYSRLSAMAQTNQMTLVPQDRMLRDLPYSDPNLAISICRYSLESGPVRLRMPTGQSFVSVLFMNKGTGVFQSVSDRAATQGMVEVVIATPAQMRRIQQMDTDDDTVQEIRLVSSDIIGLALVRAVVPIESQRRAAEQLVRSASCDPEAL